MDQPNPVGRPSKYRPEFCRMLVDHMEKGGSFQSFGAIAECHWDSLYEWAKEYPEFSEAKKLGEAKALRYWEELAKAGVSGQLRRVEKETPLLGPDGKPVLDKQGNVVYHREYAPAQFAQTAWLFTMLNKFPGIYKDRRHIALSGDGAGAPIKHAHVHVQLTPEEKLKEIVEAQKVLQELNGAGTESIKITD